MVWAVWAYLALPLCLDDLTSFFSALTRSVRGVSSFCWVAVELGVPSRARVRTVKLVMAYGAIVTIVVMIVVNVRGM